MKLRGLDLPPPKDMHSWYEFQNSGQKETTLFLYDEIGGFGKSATAFIEDLQAIPKDHRLVLRIHSPGGSILDGNAIFTALKGHPGGVTTQIDGLAASMASVVAIAGAPVRMAGNAMMMIHNANGMVAGDSDDMRKMADTMDKIQTTIERAYVGKTGMSRKKIKEMMDAETWMTATEAEEFGFVDEVTGDLQMAAHFDLSKFSNVPETLTEPETQMATLKDSLATAEARAEDLEAQLDAQVKLFTELETETAKFKTEHDKAKAELATLQATNETLKSEIVTLGKTIQERTTEVATQAGKITELEKEAKSVDERAREIAGRFGVLLPEKDISAIAAGGSIAEAVLAETDPVKRVTLFRKNKEAIIAANWAEKTGDY